ncbi:hypothetical protein [Thermosyntropha sp.]|uniref:hypothetical protein n=1 Tax=Thermosyntropha sp. TaxID=2740820 RepID=UPI0025FD77E8|nr:hypothetical protein [Thermosyntropha sp.]MBO8159467.1 hypothetical protein [Thermosyntropha sp.]
MDFVGLSPSTYYENISRKHCISEKNKSEVYAAPKNVGGRPFSGYSLTGKGEKISDEQIKEFLCELVCGDGFMDAYRIITEYMEFYNQRRRHGSIKFMTPTGFYEAFMSNSVKLESFSA